MRLQSRFIRQVLIGALSLVVCSTILASEFYGQTADTSNSATFAGVDLHGAGTDPRQDKGPQAIPPLPASVMNTELNALDNSTFRLADYRGKVVLLNLWATWCGPCRSDIPHLVKISHEFGTRGVEVVGLTTEDPQTSVDRVRDFVSEFHIPYKIVWGNKNFGLALMQGQVRSAIPQSFVISRDGRVLKRFVGFSQVETPPKMRQALEEALNEN